MADENTIIRDHKILKHPAKDVRYDNISSGLSATTSQDAIDEIAGGGGSGDMLKTTYDTDDNGRVDVAEGLNNGTQTATTLEIRNHLDDTGDHFSEASIDHTNISNVGSNAHSVIDTHLGDGAKHFLEGSIDHGSVAGLGDDDHSAYPLVDGTRGFSGVVPGVTPVVSADLATKGYVDGIVIGLDWQDSVLDRDLTAPPGGESVGDRYIPKATATGDWAGHENDIATVDSTGPTVWSFVTPTEGTALWIEDEDVQVVWNGSAFVKFGSTVDHNNTVNTHNLTTDIDHDQITNKGSNAHSVIDTHLGSTSDPHNVTKAQVGLTNVTDDSQLKRSANDISTFDEKVTPVSADLLLIEDSAAAGVKKRVQIGNLPGGGGGGTDNDLDSTPDSDHAFNGFTSDMTAGENVVFGDLCFIKSDGKLWKADADSASTMPGLYMAAATILADAVGSFGRSGFARDDTWTWTVGDAIYASTTLGGLTQTAPAGLGDQVQVIGYPKSADVMDFNPSRDVTEV